MYKLRASGEKSWPDREARCTEFQAEGTACTGVLWQEGVQSFLSIIFLDAVECGGHDPISGYRLPGYKSCLCCL